MRFNLLKLLAQAMTPVLMCIPTTAVAEGTPLKLLSPSIQAQSFDHAHANWNEALKTFVIKRNSQSRVRYEALRANPKGLQQYLNEIGSISESEFQGYSETQRIAFLINAYNAYTVALIANNYPTQSIKKIGGWFSSPWKIKFFRLRGEVHALDDIEHQMLRKEFNEPRIHFALVCAAVSCPALRNEAYVPDRLNLQLDDAADQFLSDPERNRYEPATKTLYLSSIFKWYGDDFNNKFGSAKDYIVSRMKQLKLISNDTSPNSIAVEYLPYDWSLNDSRN